jgi:hypothetical protein
MHRMHFTASNRVQDGLVPRNGVLGNWESPEKVSCR